MRLALLISVVVAALSLLVWTAPGYDPYAWIVWGREIAHLDLNLVGGPSWKPMPVVFTTAFSVFGTTAAPLLWLLVARAGALLAVVMAFRVGDRLAGRTAGLAAAVALVLLRRWVSYPALGFSEPLVIALVLGAVDRHLNGQTRFALVLGFAASLARPEVAPVVIAYGAWLAFARPRVRPLLLGLGGVFVLLWFGAAYWGSGDWLAALDRAKDSYQAHELGATAQPILEAVHRAYETAPLPVLFLAALGAFTGWLRRDRTILAIAAATVAWFAVVIAMGGTGYPGLIRFMVPPGALLCVLAGVAVAAVMRARPSRAWRWASAVALVAVTVPWAVPRVGEALDNSRSAAFATSMESGLRTAVRRAGGRARILACGQPATNALAQSDLAWVLHVPLHAVGRVQWRPPAVVFRGRFSAWSGSPPARPARGAGARMLARVPHRWDVLAVPTGSHPCSPRP